MSPALSIRDQRTALLLAGHITDAIHSIAIAHDPAEALRALQKLDETIWELGDRLGPPVQRALNATGALAFPADNVVALRAVA